MPTGLGDLNDSVGPKSTTYADLQNNSAGITSATTCGSGGWAPVADDLLKKAKGIAVIRSKRRISTATDPTRYRHWWQARREPDLAFVCILAA